MNIDKMLEWLRKTEIPLTTISKKTNISRKTLYNWINGGEVRKRSYLKVYDIYKHDIELTNTQIQLDRGNNMEAQYIINLQKEKIERLEDELSQIKKSPFQSTEWNSLEYHIYNEVKLKFSLPNKLSRTVKVLKGKKHISNILGYTKEEIEHYWQVGITVEKFEDHPIENIITKQSQKELQHRIKTMPTLFENLKYMIGNHYIPVGIGFIAKEGHVVHAISYNKVDWKNRYVFSKTQFLLDE